MAIIGQCTFHIFREFSPAPCDTEDVSFSVEGLITNRILICKKYNPTTRAIAMLIAEMWEVQRHGWHRDYKDDVVRAQHANDAT
jgi:hypothetical protein